MTPAGGFRVHESVVSSLQRDRLSGHGEGVKLAIWGAKALEGPSDCGGRFR